MTCWKFDCCSVVLSVVNLRVVEVVDDLGIVDHLNELRTIVGLLNCPVDVFTY